MRARKASASLVGGFFKERAIQLVRNLAATNHFTRSLNLTGRSSSEKTHVKREFRIVPPNPALYSHEEEITTLERQTQPT
jgi:hypothetical protein